MGPVNSKILSVGQFLQKVYWFQTRTTTTQIFVGLNFTKVYYFLVYYFLTRLYLFFPFSLWEDSHHDSPRRSPPPKKEKKSKKSRSERYDYDDYERSRKRSRSAYSRSDHHRKLGCTNLGFEICCSGFSALSQFFERVLG